MEPLPTDSLAPYVGIVLWRQNLLGRQVFVVEHGEQVVLPKGPLEPDEGEAAATTRLAEVFAGSRVSTLRHLFTDHPEGPEGRACVGWWSVEWMGIAPSGAEPFSGRGRWVDASEASTLLFHPRERELVGELQPSRLENFQGLLRRWSGAPRDLTRRNLLHRRQSILGRSTDADPDARWQREALEQINLAERHVSAGDGLGYREALGAAWRLELQGFDGWELEQAGEELEIRVKDELRGLERNQARALLNDARDVQSLTRVASILENARRRTNLRRAGRAEQQRWLGMTILVGVLGIWMTGPGGGAADPTHLVLLLHGLLGGALSALLWPLSDADDPVLPQMGRLLMRPLLGVLCALILCQLLSLGVLRLGSDGESAWRLAAFVAGFGERLFTRLR
jgi:hypothetical protein